MQSNRVSARSARSFVPPMENLARRHGSRTGSRSPAPFTGIHGRAPGYFGKLLLTQEMSCVSAACMVVPRAAFESVGGFDESNLAPSFNDVDFCIRLRRAGYRIMWTPHARLHHRKTQDARQSAATKNEADARGKSRHMRESWGKVSSAIPSGIPIFRSDRTTRKLACRLASLDPGRSKRAIEHRAKNRTGGSQPPARRVRLHSPSFALPAEPILLYARGSATLQKSAPRRDRTGDSLMSSRYQRPDHRRASSFVGPVARPASLAHLG